MNTLEEYRATRARCKVGQDDADCLTISGLGASFNNWYPVHGFKERVAPGAFSKTLAENPDILGMFNHDPGFLLGRTKSGTMDVDETPGGLEYVIRVHPDVSRSKDVVLMIERGDVDGSSMAFTVHQEDWEEKNGRPTHRTIKEIALIETGPVVMPASRHTSAKVQRSISDSGIDWDAITEALVIRRAGFALTMTQDDLVAQSIKKLEALSEPEPREEIHSGNSTARISAAAWALRRRAVLSVL
jgi:hypothetical protein